MTYPATELRKKADRYKQLAKIFWWFPCLSVELRWHAIELNHLALMGDYKAVQDLYK